ncbi:HEPN domain-containing protein [Halobellus ordinarius]|uniref:HEPN domain-containing protein n=1 Tax=Halobellus ordinarius TaxID=3075120 RepID=UPI00287FFBCC|nr:HEPN domain-containing protein [Halobellus sp. ZY16]
MSESTEESEFDIDDENLYDSLSSYIESVLNIVSSLPNTDLENRRTVPQPQEGSFVETNAQDIDVGKAKQLAESIAWEEFPGYSECESAFEISDLYSKEAGYAVDMGVIEDIDTQDKLVKENSLPKFLTRYLIKNGELEYDEEKLEQTYTEFEDYLKSDSIKYRGTALLSGFEMEPEELELGSDLKMREIGEDEKRDLLRYGRAYRTQTPGGYYVIEKTYTVNKFEGSRRGPATESFHNLILGLRLFDIEGDVGYTAYTVEPQSPFHIEANPRAVGHVTPIYGKPYQLQEDNAEDFVEFWRKIGKYLSSPPESYRIAIDKFSTSFNRTNENDRLLDSVIALEAIYLKSTETQEMSYRLSQRGALLLGNTKDEAKEIQSTLRDAYNHRSSLVHGSSTDVEQDSVIELHELTRRSLSKFLHSYADDKDHQEILSELDEEAITPAN